MTIDEYLNTPLGVENELSKIFDKQDKLIIFDIGACEGEDSLRYSKLFPNSTIYSFEPLPLNFKKVQETLNNYNISNVIVSNIALSNNCGTSKFYVSNGRPEGKNEKTWDYGNKSSSILKPTDNLKKIHEWLKFDKTIEIETLTLDKFCKDNNITEIDYIHMDVQGAEIMVLNGANRIISNIKAIWMEVENVELYTNQPLKEEVEKYMKKHGFTKAMDRVDAVSGDQFYINNLLNNHKNAWYKNFWQ
jgi:FkbM family methyltransferase